MSNKHIIAAARTDCEFNSAIDSNVKIIFLLCANILDLNEKISKAHNSGKKLFIHIDLAEGIGKDAAGITYIKNQGADGIISTRTNIIKLAKNIGLFTVQRFFIVDSQSVNTTIESALSSKPDMIEIMPGTICKVITKLKEKLSLPIVAGGMIETEDEINSAIHNGAAAISTGKTEFWRLI